MSSLSIALMAAMTLAVVFLLAVELDGAEGATGNGDAASGSTDATPTQVR